MTKTGDKGETGLLSGERVPKTHVRVEAIGVIDELNAILGLIQSETANSQLKTIQEDLFELGALLADTKTRGSMNEALKRLESWAYPLEESLPELRNFILPSGQGSAALAHLARVTCRRAERAMLKIENLPTGALPYVNRLSDFLFLLARKFNIDSKTDELIWKKI